MNKWEQRSRDIGASGAPVGIASQLYRVRALTTLSYVGQLCPPPSDIDAREHKCIERLMHLPRNTLGWHWHLDLQAMAGPRFGSARAHLAATKTRAALVTFPKWRPLALRLQAVMSQHATLAEFGAGHWWPSGWDGPPYVAHLAEAAGAFTRSIADKCLRPQFETMFVSERPQADAERLMTSALAPGRLICAMARRLRGNFPDENWDGVEADPIEMAAVLSRVPPQHAMAYWRAPPHQEVGNKAGRTPLHRTDTPCQLRTP